MVISSYQIIVPYRVIYSSSDDYSGKYMTNPMVPKNFTNVTDASVVLEKHVIIGCGATILPGVILEEGVAIGAMSLVQMNCKSNMIYTGNPLKKLIPRSKDYKKLETKL